MLLVQRFDRESVAQNAHDTPHYLRHRMVSAFTVRDADDSADARAQWSYVVLADELRRWSMQRRADRHKLFRRMVFNALVSNLDDYCASIMRTLNEGRSTITFGRCRPTANTK